LSANLDIHHDVVAPFFCCPVARKPVLCVLLSGQVTEERVTS
jgi:hypothetical protein